MAPCNESLGNKQTCSEVLPANKVSTTLGTSSKRVKNVKADTLSKQLIRIICFAFLHEREISRSTVVLLNYGLGRFTMASCNEVMGAALT